MLRFQNFAGGIDLSTEDYSFIRQELEVDPEAILSGGRTLIEHFGWLAVQAFDIHYYGSELADPKSTAQEKAAFSFGIAKGYELTLGLAAYIENLRLASIDTLGLDEDDLTVFMETMRNKGVPSRLIIEAAGMEFDEEYFAEITSSDVFFHILADRMAEDKSLNGIIEFYEQLIRGNRTLSSYGNSEVEHHVAGVMHGLASAYGLMRVLYGQSFWINQVDYYANGGEDQ